MYELFERVFIQKNNVASLNSNI